MKRQYRFTLILLLAMLSGCDGNKDDLKCYPTRVKRTVSTGTGANATTADYRYIGNLVDRIIWSNSETHYYFYDPSNRIQEIERVNVERLQKTELLFHYESDHIFRIDESLMTLDFLTQEDEDTSFVGYRELIYEDDRVVEENVYVHSQDDNGKFVHTFKEEFSYDAAGNLVSYDVTDMVQDKLVESYSMTYDLAKNPYSAINFFFDEASHVNNMLEKKDLLTDETYTYQIIYNASKYPQQINVKLEDYLSEVISFEYECW